MTQGGGTPPQGTTTVAQVASTPHPASLCTAAGRPWHVRSEKAPGEGEGRTRARWGGLLPRTARCALKTPAQGARPRGG